MRNLNLLDIYRNTAVERRFYGTDGDHSCGVFSLLVNGIDVRVIASAGEGWDHVSVSKEDSCPTWDEMEAVKRLFFKDDETAMQLHVPPADHINCHPNCLHLWRPHDRKIPMPPSFMVGTK